MHLPWSFCLTSSFDWKRKSERASAALAARNFDLGFFLVLFLVPSRKRIHRFFFGLAKKGKWLQRASFAGTLLRYWIPTSPGSYLSQGSVHRVISSSPIRRTIESTPLRALRYHLTCSLLVHRTIIAALQRCKAANLHYQFPYALVLADKIAIAAILVSQARG